MRAKEFIVETAMMGKIADSGKIIRILKKAHTVPFSDEKNWLLVDTDPGKGNSGLGIKWIPADTRFEWVRPYRDSIDENFADDSAEAYRAHLIKTLPQIMKLFANIGKGWIPSKEQMLNAVDTAYRVMKHTGDAKQAGKVLMDELNTLYRMSQGKQGVAEGLLGTVLPWPEVVNKVNSAMKAMGWKGQRKADGSFMFSTKGQLDDEFYIVIIDNEGNSMFTYALGTVEEGDPHIGEQDTLPTTEASVSELMNAIQDGFGLNENFADGRNPEDKGDSKRHGINTRASVSSLRKTAKSGGRKGQLAHWLANMKSGRAKAKSKNENIEQGLNSSKESKLVTQDYMAGHCHVMAIALKMLHPDWQIRAHVGWDDDAADDTEYRVDHVYTVAPDGSAYDCRGRFDSEEALVGQDATGGVETQYADVDLQDIKQLVQRGELKQFTRQDIDSAMRFAKQIGQQGVAEEMQHKKITELFDAETAFSLQWDNQFAGRGEVHAEAYDADGRTIDISFTPTGYGRGIEIVFKRGGSYDLTGQGDASRVLATVVNAISQYLQKYQPPYIAFSAKSTGGRAGAYTAMIKRLARGYTLLDPEEYPEEVMGFLDYLGSDKPFILVRS